MREGDESNNPFAFFLCPLLENRKPFRVSGKPQKTNKTRFIKPKVYSGGKVHTSPKAM